MCSYQFFVNFTIQSCNIHDSVFTVHCYEGFGFNIRGGEDHPHVGADPGIFITTVRADGAAGRDGRLKSGDRILAVSKLLTKI